MDLMKMESQDGNEISKKNFCPYCDQKIEDDANFCYNCGNKLIYDVFINTDKKIY